MNNFGRTNHEFVLSIKRKSTSSWSSRLRTENRAENEREWPVD